MSVRVSLRGIERMVSRAEAERRQEEYAMRCALAMRRYVPIEEGTLRGSEPLSSDYRRGVLTWNTPYAARHYYVPMRHAEPGTTDHWDEECGRNDMPALLSFAETLYRGY